MSVGTVEDAVHAVHPRKPPPRGWRRFVAPGFLRCLWTVPLMFGIGVGLMALVRWLEGWYPIWLGDVVVTISLVTIPLGFLGRVGGVCQPPPAPPPGPAARRG